MRAAAVGRRVPRNDVEARHGRDRRQRLAAEAEASRWRRGPRPEASRWRGARPRGEVVGIHAVAVVGDADQAPASGLDDDVDARGAGIERVLDEFLDGARRPLDHFAGGDAIDENGIKAANRHGLGCTFRQFSCKYRF